MLLRRSHPACRWAKGPWDPIFRKVVYPEGGFTVLLLALFSFLFTIINVPLGLVIIDYESSVNRQSTLLTRLQTATSWIFVLWTPVTLTDIFR